MYIRTEECEIVNTNYIVTAYAILTRPFSGEKWIVRLFLATPDEDNAIITYRSFKNRHDAKVGLDELYRILP
jgi:hypothetical protein